VAKVPLAKDKSVFWSVIREGTRVLLDAARHAGVRKVVYIVLGGGWNGIAGHGIVQFTSLPWCGRKQRERRAYRLRDRPGRLPAEVIAGQ
jgi:hypothetical protein